MTERYPTPAAEHRVEESREHSRFITTVARAASVDEAREFIARTSRGFADATHNCWAYVVGPPGDLSRIGMSDAGEPHGTAGRPMLNVLLGSGVGDIAAVVTRYYGGTKLGRGGLVRAYGGGVKLALETLPLTEFVQTVELRATIPYAGVTQLKNILPTFEAEILGETYGTNASFHLRLPREHASKFAEALSGITNGVAAVEPWAA